MSNYKYKGSLISYLTVTDATQLTGYTPITYRVASNFATERPLPFNFKQNGVDISTLMDASFVEFNSGTSSYTVPGDFNKIRAVLIGGAGGGGGGGGCGVDGNGQPQSRQSGGPGGDGKHGGFLYLTDTVLNGRTIQYLVGSGGQGGGGGQNVGNTTQLTDQPGQPGQPGGAGQVSRISFNSPNGAIQVEAPTSNSAPGGPGGPGTGTPGGANIEQGINPNLFSNTGNNFIKDGDDQLAIPALINPNGYKSNRGNLGQGGGRNPDGDGYVGQDGQQGYIRIYLLKD